MFVTWFTNTDLHRGGRPITSGEKTWCHIILYLYRLLCCFLFVFGFVCFHFTRCDTYAGAKQQIVLLSTLLKWGTVGMKDKVRMKDFWDQREKKIIKRKANLIVRGTSLTTLNHMSWSPSPVISSIYRDKNTSC